MAMTIEAQESAGMKPGAYEGTITDIVEQDGTYQGELTEQYKFTILVDGETKLDGSPVEQWAYCNRVLSPKSKLWEWIKSYTGTPPQIGAAVDMEAIFLGNRVGFLISINDTGKSKVTSIYPLKGAKAAAPAAKAAPGQSAEADAEALVCAFPKCGRPAFSVDEDGNNVCPKHGGLPE